jgi:hypothetical protein
MAGNLLHSTVPHEHSDISDLQDDFAHVHGSIGIMDQSYVCAGLQCLCLPDLVDVSWAKLCAHLTQQASQQLAAAWHAAVGTRSQTGNVRSLLDSILRRLYSEDRGLCRPVPGQKILLIGDGLAGVQLKEGCNEKRSLIMWVELRPSKDKGSSVYRGIRNSPPILNAVLNNPLILSTKRSSIVTVSQGLGSSLLGAGASWTKLPFAIRLWSSRVNHWSECSSCGTIVASWQRRIGGAFWLFSRPSKTCGQLGGDFCISITICLSSLQERLCSSWPVADTSARRMRRCAAAVSVPKPGV